MTLFTGITPLFGSSLLYAGPASLVWGWVVVTFFTWFVGIAMAEICSSFPVSPSLYLSPHFFPSKLHYFVLQQLGSKDVDRYMVKYDTGLFRLVPENQTFFFFFLGSYIYMYIYDSSKTVRYRNSTTGNDCHRFLPVHWYSNSLHFWC